jgi:hypothetical protein
LAIDKIADEPAPANILGGASRRRGATGRHPFTHHEILRLIEPFIRRERHVDLAASDRAARRLAFKPFVFAQADEPHESGGANPESGDVSEVLQLENPERELFRLTRTLTFAGVSATLTAEGVEPGDLLARIEAVPFDRQFQRVGKVMIAQSYRLSPARDGTPMLILTLAEARLEGLIFTLKADTGKGYPAEIALSSNTDQPLDLPEDLLAALGWDWRVLRRRGTAWVSTVRAPGKEPARSRHVEAALRRGVSHLARTFAEPPRRFHERFAGARWTVVFRRSIPVLLSVFVLAGGAAVTVSGIPEDSPFQMLLFNFPPLLLLLVFGMRALPRFEIPPFPRPSDAPSWIATPVEGGAE